MKCYKQINQILLYLLLVAWITGCSSPATEQLNSSSTETPLVQSATVIATNRLQLTYIENHDNFGELYTSDINCVTQEKACFGEPKLLLDTLAMPNNEQNKPKGLLTDYSWSPDGNKIALISTGDILIGDIHVQSWKNITNSSDVDEYQPKWSSDGNSIYYRACPRTLEGKYGGHGACKLYRSDLTGKVESILLDSKNDYYNSYDVSQDGQKVVFTLTDDQGYDQIYQSDLDGTDRRQITTGQMNNYAPSFSPDEKKIVFVRSGKPVSADATLQSDTVVIDLTTGEEKNLTKEFDGNVFTPVFSPNGKWVAFSSFDTELNANIFIVSLDPEILIQVTHTNREVSPAWRQSSDSDKQ